MTPYEETLARALEEAYRVLVDVQSQIRGALCMQEIEQAIQHVNRVTREHAHACRNCGMNAGLLDICGECEAEAFLLGEP